MSKDVSIVFKASDNLTNSVKQMRKSVDGLSRDVTEYRKVQDQVFSKKAEVKFDMTKAKRELKDLEKAVKENVEGSEKAFKEKQKQIEALNEEYRRLGQVAKEASKAERQLSEDISRSSNKNASRGSSGGLITGLASAGLGNMISSSIGNTLNQQITATYGTTLGSTVSTMASGVLGGAAMGSIAGPIGAAVGAAVGGLTGAINALSQKQEAKDDIFREEVQDIYSLVKSEQSSAYESGIYMASEREQLVMGLGTLLGSQEEGAKMFNEIKQFGIDTPYEGTSMIDAAKQMLAYGVKAENVMDDMKMLGEVAMGDQNKFNSLSYAYAQTQSAGKLTGQDLLQYTAAGFNPLSVLAEETGQTLAEMRDLMSDGLISSEDVTRAFRIATEEGGKFYGAMSAQMETYGGKLAMLNDLHDEISVGYGEGYNAKRSEGMTKEIEQLNGELGDRMKEAYSLIGEYQAEMENQYQQSIIDSITAIQETNEYRKAQEEGNGAEMGRLIAEARAKAEIEYRNSEAVILQKEADLGLVESIQQDAAINDAYMEYGRKMGDAFSKGYSGAIQGIIEQGTLAQEQINSLVNEKGSFIQKFTNNAKQKSYSDETLAKYSARYATGTDRVPYNDMPALLHEGERVLTKVEADKMDKASNLSPTINITVNNNSSSTYEITQEICNQIMKASEVYAGRM